MILQLRKSSFSDGHGAPKPRVAWFMVAIGEKSPGLARLFETHSKPVGFAHCAFDGWLYGSLDEHEASPVRDFVALSRAEAKQPKAAQSTFLLKRAPRTQSNMRRRGQLCWRSVCPRSSRDVDCDPPRLVFRHRLCLPRFGLRCRECSAAQNLLRTAQVPSLGW